MIKDDPYTRQQRHQLASSSLLFGVLTLLTIVQFINPNSDIFSKFIFPFAMCFFFIIGGVGIFFSLKRLKRLTQLRESVRRGGSVSLAKEQPAPDATALPVIATIKLNNSKTRIIRVGVMLAIFLFILFVVGLLAGTNNSNKGHSSINFLPLFLAIFGVFTLVLLVASFLIFWLMCKQMICRIVIDEHSLSSTYQGITSSIRWSDACLFTITSPDKPTVLRVYELANATTVVHWMNLSSQPLFGWNINAASIQYRNNVQALLSVVAARTGLPLYDFDATLKAQKKESRHD